MIKQEAKIIARVAAKLKKRYCVDTTGHDWFHLERVWNMAKRLARGERVNHFILEMAALLHDVDDYKVKKEGEWEFERTEKILGPLHLDERMKRQIYVAIRTVSFKGAGVDTTPATIEGKIVQDADRLDAMGAIGIARVFAYGGSAGHPYYDPSIRPQLHKSFAQYKHHKKTTINHFYEKLLLLKNRMNTPRAKKIAQHRHRVLEQYLKEFFDEVEGRT